MSKEEKDRLFGKIQWATALLLHEAKESPYGYKIEPSVEERRLLREKMEIDGKLIRNIFERYVKVGIFKESTRSSEKGKYIIFDQEAFIERLGIALGFEKEVEKRIKEAEAK